MAQKNRPQAETLYGLPQPLQANLFPTINANRDPTAQDTGYPLTQVWNNVVGGTYWVLNSVAGGAALWLEMVSQGGPGSFTTLTSTSTTTLATTDESVNTFGNAVGATSVGITSGTGGIALTSTGTGDITLDSDDTLLIDADGVLELNSSAGAISIGNDANAQAINIGTGAAARTITIGNTTGATAINLTSGSGAVNVNTNLNLTSVATQITMNGGAVTDFIGTATLVNGTVTVANTNIAAADQIQVTREGINGSTALGVFDTAITPATSFSITARNPTDATTQTNDTSIVKYIIFRQT